MKTLIWGTGFLAADYMRCEYFSEHDIVGFVDTFKKADSFMGYPVYTPSHIKKLDFDTLVVCVARKNEEILKKCIAEKIDLNKVFFIDDISGFGDISDGHVEQLMDDNNIKKNFAIIYKIIEERRLRGKYISDNVLNSNFDDQAFIKNFGNTHVIVRIPIELLFSERLEDIVPDGSHTEAWKEQIRVWGDHPIICFEPHRDLFQFFMTGEKFPRRYCDWWQSLFSTRKIPSGFSNEGLIEKRFREFMIMQSELNQGMDFFIDHPAIARWNKNGYFNLIDGHHRALFLYYSGITKIPVQITQKDYLKWRNDAVAESVRNIISSQHRSEFYQPILNPYFWALHSYRDNFAKSRLHHLLEYMNATRLKGKTVLDIGACLGFFGQMFSRMGAEVTMLEPDPLHFELLNEVNRLLYINCEILMQPFEGYETDKRYDVAILLTVLYRYLADDNIRKGFFDKMNEYVRTAIIWESGDMPEEERKEIMDNTKFKRYHHLCCTYATGRFREMGIFFVDNGKI